MTSAQFIFNALTKQDMIYVVAFMEENKDATLEAAINWLFEVIVVDGEDVICKREHDVYAAHMRQCRNDICYYYGHNILDLVEDEALPF